MKGIYPTHSTIAMRVAKTFDVKLLPLARLLIRMCISFPSTPSYSDKTHVRLLSKKRKDHCATFGQSNIILCYV